jgi:CheY-like chemotaxis protein
MGRVVVIHWSVAEGEERSERLRTAGHDVEVLAPRGGPGMRPVVENPPDAVVIDLDLRPSEGRDLALYMRQRTATRHVPIVFVEGDQGKVAKIRELLPDAVYATWRGVRGAVKRAIARPPGKPVVRDAMAGYSGTPLPRKLGIKTGSVVTLMGAPAGFQKTLGELPNDVRIKRQARGKANLVMLFVKSKTDLDRRLATAERAMAEKGTVWIAWPKKSSGAATDLTQTDVRRKGLASGLVDFKICAIDETWSALRFSRRR